MQPKRVSRTRKRWFKITVVVVVLGGVWGGIKVRDKLLPRYYLWKQERALAQARDFMKQADQRNAKIALDVALLAAPGNPGAWRTAAEFLEQNGAMQAVRVRRQIVELSPNTLDDRIALITTAIRFNDKVTAREALSGMTVEQAQQPEALRAALAFALATNNSPVADALYDRLKKIYPDDQELRYDHAALRCLIPNPDSAAAARAEVEKFTTVPTYRLRALRWLLVDALRRNDNAMARQWSQQLADDPGAEINDLLHRANVAILIEGQKLESILPGLETRAASRAGDVATLVRWLINQKRVEPALVWLAKLPTEMTLKPEVADVGAELALYQQNWRLLGSLLEQGAWGKVAPETVQLAMSARVMADRQRTDLRKRVWEEAITSAGTNSLALRMLARLSGAWKWETEMEQTLWAVARAYPDQTWAHLALFYGYRAKKNAAGMREVASVLRQQDASLARYQHEWALLSLLIDPSKQWNNDKELMKTLYESAKTNPYYMTGYGLALAQAGRGADALKVIEPLTDLDRALPSRAPYLAYIYGVNKMAKETNLYLAAAANLDLLDEERSLLRQATEALTARPDYVRPPKENKKPKAVAPGASKAVPPPKP
ncbi:MAG: hypothetical protein HY302_10445 [Opitutae bacterium]|nr:hypothetical protein [Opitutae bacterium]